MREIIKKWNPWWVNGEVPKNRTRIERKYVLDKLINLISAKEMIILTGVRRCGKSTLMHQIINLLIKEKVNPKNILFFNFDDFADLEIDEVYNFFLKENNPKGKKYIFFDEIQNINNWQKWAKTKYDLESDDLKMFFTGSNNSLLENNVSKLLTGRNFNKKIFPLSFNEFLKFKNVEVKDFDIQKQEIRHFLKEYFEVGGFPESVLEIDNERKDQRLKEYYNSILLRDIVEPNELREVSKLVDLTNFSINNISNLFSYNKISKNLGININSVKEYLFHLQNANLIFLVNYFSYSVKESLLIQKPKKIYAIDTGMRNSVSLRFSKDEGRIAENIVFIELLRRENKIFYWKGKNEVDFIVENKKEAINVCFSNNINQREILGLKELNNDFKKIIITDELEKEEEGIEYIPLWKWLVRENIKNGISKEVVRKLI